MKSMTTVTKLSTACQSLPTSILAVQSKPTQSYLDGVQGPRRVGRGWRKEGQGGGAHLKFEELNGVAHADGQGPALHQKLDGAVQLLRQVPRQHLACSKCQSDSDPLHNHQQQCLTAADQPCIRAILQQCSNWAISMAGGQGMGGGGWYTLQEAAHSGSYLQHLGWKRGDGWREPAGL